MRIIVNGESCSLEEPLDLGHLFRKFRIPSDRVAVMVNHCIVPKAGRDEVRLQEGDRVEVVTFVAGG